MTAVAEAEEQVVLVDEANQIIGHGAKLQVHQEGRLHRAFSIFVVDRSGAVLLQRRALDKYHSGGRWSNTCCGHPRPGEDLLAAATRRLGEEMGFSCPLRFAFDFRYKARVGGDLLEHEHDSILIGHFDGVPRPNPAEVAEWKRESLSRVRGEIRRRPNRYTVWLRLLLGHEFPRLLNAVTQSGQGHPA